MNATESVFDKAVKFILENEGGFSNDAHDIGGMTKYGISKRSYPNLDIANLTLNQAIEIYKQDFWHPYYDQIIYSEIAIKIFDLAVNMGAKHSHLILQKSLNFIGNKVTEDGLLAQETLLATNKSNPELLMRVIKLAAEIHYRLTVQNNSKETIFLAGWLKRAYA